MKFESILKFIEEIIQKGIEEQLPNISIEVDLLEFIDFLITRKLVSKDDLDKLDNILDNLDEIIENFANNKKANLLTNLDEIVTKNKIVKSE